MADISQVNIEEMSREYSKEEVARLMNEIMKNNATMLKITKTTSRVARNEKKTGRDKEKRTGKDKRTGRDR